MCVCVCIHRLSSAENCRSICLCEGESWIDGWREREYNGSPLQKTHVFVFVYVVCVRESSHVCERKLVIDQQRGRERREKHTTHPYATHQYTTHLGPLLQGVHCGVPHFPERFHCHDWTETRKGKKPNHRECTCGVPHFSQRLCCVNEQKNKE